jgi:hypothetical protein
MYSKGLVDNLEELDYAVFGGYRPILDADMLNGKSSSVVILGTPLSYYPTLTPVSLSAGFVLTALAPVSTTPRFLSVGYAD